MSASSLLINTTFTLVLATSNMLTSSNADDNAYLGFFAGAYRSCSELYPPEQVSASRDIAAERRNCYLNQVVAALSQLPPDSPVRLQMALQVAPEYADGTFVSALQAGFDPYYAVTTATRALPEQDLTFANLAIARGADPSQVTQATAAGLRRHLY